MGLEGAMRTRSSGMSIIEVVFALTIMAMLAMTLSLMIATSQRLTNESRERSLASNAIRAYCEAMRKLTRAQFMIDTRTPADFAPSTGVNKLRGLTGEVFKINYESGASGTRVSGAAGAGAIAVTAFNEGTKLGFPRDLTANGDTTQSPVVTTTTMHTIPARVKLTWETFSGKRNQTESMVVYVSFTLR